MEFMGGAMPQACGDPPRQRRQKGPSAGPYLRSLVLGTPGPRARRQFSSARQADLVRVLGFSDATAATSISSPMWRM